MSNYNIKSNLSEKQIESDLSGYFGWMSRGTPFRLFDIDEQMTGADKQFYDSGFAFFMQFKVSNGLHSASVVPLSKRINKSVLEHIREFRSSNGFGDNPSLYFGLREKAKNAKDLQHNILLKYVNKSYCQAFYVAPLLLTTDDYYNCLFDSVNRYRNHPYFFKRNRIYNRDWVSYVEHVPYLKEHVSIIPHQKVRTHKHYYSYSRTGCDIGWHSPELITREPSRLSDILSNEIVNCLNNEKLTNINELIGLLEIENDTEKDQAEEPIKRIQSWAKQLYYTYGIRMYLFLGSSKYIR